MIIGGEERGAAETFDDRSPIDTDLVVARFPVGSRQDVRDAIDGGAGRVSRRGATRRGAIGSRSCAARPT